MSTDSDHGTVRSARRLTGEISGACGDLGTLVPYAVGAMTVAGMSAFGILLGFGVFLVASGLYFAIPIAVQPMKAVGALIITGELSPAEVALTGVLTGLILIVGAATGLIGRLARLIPRSVTAGLQLGLGAMMIAFGLALVMRTSLEGLALLALLLVLMATRRAPAALIVVVAAVALGWWQASPAGPSSGGWTFPDGWASVDVWHVILGAVLPQFGLTLTNAIVVTVVVARDLFPRSSDRVSESGLAWSTGLANLGLAPLGALPMCHGAGGLQAQHRFGARTRLAPILLGSALLVLAIGFADQAAALLIAMPAGALGALLIVAGVDLAMSPRLFDARPDCRPAIALTALATVVVNPAAGLALGWAVEAARSRFTARLR